MLAGLECTIAEKGFGGCLSIYDKKFTMAQVS